MRPLGLGLCFGIGLKLAGAAADDCAGKEAGTYCVGPPIAPIFPLNRTILSCPQGNRDTCRAGTYCGPEDVTGDPPGKAACRPLAGDFFGTVDSDFDRAPIMVVSRGPTRETPERALCMPCVELGSGINTLSSYVLGAGAVGTCPNVCSNMPSKVGQLVCSITCDSVGVTAFMQALNRTGLDPIFFCEEVRACPRAPSAAAAEVQPVWAEPQSVAKGGVVELLVKVEVASETGVGEFEVVVDGPVTAKVRQSFLVPNGFDQGTNLLGVKLTVVDDKSGAVVWSPGEYTFSFSVCQGMCGSECPRTKVFGTQKGRFTLTEALHEISI